MNTRELSALAGVSGGTLNVWVSRGYIPGVTDIHQGKRRVWAPASVQHVIIMARLVCDFGLGAPRASKLAALAATDRCLRIKSGPVVLTIDTTDAVEG